MEIYTFTGIENGQSTLRIKSDHPVELSFGFQRYREEMTDCDVLYSFSVTEKIKEEQKGNDYYIWYRVENYVCEIDKAAAVGRKADRTALTNGIVFVAMSENGGIDEVTAGEHSDLFAEWQPNVAYRAGNIRRHGGGILYKCLQGHTSQADWEPDKSPSLWKKIGDQTDEYPQWSQPISAADAYQNGDKVSHADKRWISTTDNNVWEPGAVGAEALWEQVV